MNFDPGGDLFDTEERPPPTSGDRLFLVLFCLGFFGLLLLEVLGEFTPAKASVFVFPIAWGLLTAAHEAAHAVAAHLCGWKVNGVVIGFGRTLLRLRVGATPVDVRLFPLAGYTLPVPVRGEGQRLANAIIYFAGPGIELALVGLLVAGLGYETMTTPTDHLGVVTAQTFAVAALMGALINLVPHVGPGGAWSDGMGLLMSPFLSPGHFEQRMAAPVLDEVQARVAANDLEGALALVEEASERYPRALGLHTTAAFLLLKLGERGQALMRLQALTRDERFSPSERRAAGELLKKARAA